MTAEALQDSIADFGALAFEAIHQLQREVKALKAELEERDKTIDLLLAKLERLGQ